MSTLNIDVYRNTSRDIITTATPANTPVPNRNATRKYSFQNTMKNAGYVPLKHIDDTLQGSVWKVLNGTHTNIIKVTNKSLHEQGLTYQKCDKKAIPISENIMKEKTILKYLTQYDPPPSLAKYIDFFSDKFNYFLVMEYGGKMSLFSFVQKCHKYIEHGILSVKEWQSVCKIALKQIVDLLDWLHNTMHCCHLDVSLENFVIDNVTATQHRDKHITFSYDFQIKLIDFGVAEVFYKRNKEDEIDFNCTKYVGKTHYKAPEVYSKTPFDARAADCWSLAVMFFMMVTGCCPLNKPSMNDEAYKTIMNGYLSDLLSDWDRSDYITSNTLHLMSCLFQKEKYRASIKDVKMHPFFL